MPAPRHTPEQRLALAICRFLTTSVSDGTLAADDKDSIDVAVSCIADSFKVDAASPDQNDTFSSSPSLLHVFSLYEKSNNNKTSSNDAPATAAAPTTSTTSAAEPSAESKKEAEALKSKGNAAMAQKDYHSAIDLYTQALALHPANAVYLSNRAAAHSAAKDHAAARRDAEAAVAIDPSYTKAWSRLGLARFALGDPRGAMDAYDQGIRHEGNGGSDAMRKGYETAKRRVDEMHLDDDSNNNDNTDGDALARGAAAGAGAGGMPDFGAGGDGMPDLGSIMNNPMFANMAQSLMSNPDLMSNLMSNPRLRDMANQFTSGGGMPDLSGLLSDPNIADMARNTMGGGGPGGPGNTNNNNNKRNNSS